MSAAGASILALGSLLPFFYLAWSLKNGKIAGPNPWRATGLEWQTPSPPPTFNFEKTPVVTTGPYAYSPEADELEDAPADLLRARVELEMTPAEIEQDHGEEAQQ